MLPLFLLFQIKMQGSMQHYPKWQDCLANDWWQTCLLSALPSSLYIIAQLNTILTVLINKSPTILFVWRLPKGKAQVTNWCCQIPGRGQEYLDKEISQCWDISKFSVGLCCLWRVMKRNAFTDFLLLHIHYVSNCILSSSCMLFPKVSYLWKWNMNDKLTS